MSEPTTWAARQIGSDRKRSETPDVKSAFSPTPEYIVSSTIVIARVPGSRYCR
jgi:hypothetical protein